MWKHLAPTLLVAFGLVGVSGLLESSTTKTALRAAILERRGGYSHRDEALELSRRVVRPLSFVEEAVEHSSRRERSHASSSTEQQHDIITIAGEPVLSIVGTGFGRIDNGFNLRGVSLGSDFVGKTSPPLNMSMDRTVNGKYDKVSGKFGWEQQAPSNGSASASSASPSLEQQVAMLHYMSANGLPYPGPKIGFPMDLEGQRMPGAMPFNAAARAGGVTYQGTMDRHDYNDSLVPWQLELWDEVRAAPEIVAAVDSGIKAAFEATNATVAFEPPPPVMQGPTELPPLFIIAANNTTINPWGPSADNATAAPAAGAGSLVLAPVVPAAPAAEAPTAELAPASTTEPTAEALPVAAPTAAFDAGAMPPATDTPQSSAAAGSFAVDALSSPPAAAEESLPPITATAVDPPEELASFEAAPDTVPVVTVDADLAPAIAVTAPNPPLSVGGEGAAPPASESAVAALPDAVPTEAVPTAIEEQAVAASTAPASQAETSALKVVAASTANATATDPASQAETSALQAVAASTINATATDPASQAETSALQVVAASTVNATATAPASQAETSALKVVAASTVDATATAPASLAETPALKVIQSVDPVNLVKKITTLDWKHQSSTPVVTTRTTKGATTQAAQRPSKKIAPAPTKKVAATLGARSPVVKAPAAVRASPEVVPPVDLVNTINVIKKITAIDRRLTEGATSPKKKVSSEDAFKQLEGAIKAKGPELVKHFGAKFQLIVSDGGVAHKINIDLKNGIGAVKYGEDKADIIITLSEADLVAMSQGKLDILHAVKAGTLMVKGDIKLAQRLSEIVHSSK